MALKSAVKTGGDFLDMKALTADGPVLVIARIREFHDPEKGDFGYLLPTVADFFIVDGEQAGEVHLNEKVIGAVTSALRGVRNPNVQKGERPQPPVNEVGDEIVMRLTLKLPGKSNSFVVGDEPSATELAAATAAYEAAGAEELWEKAGAAQAEREPVGATSGGGAKRPW